jgi:hypothetical protein
MTNNFYDLVQVRQLRGCKTCRTVQYTFPQPIGKSIEDYLLPFGKLAYDLDIYSIIKIDNDAILLQSKLGTVDMHVKFKDKEDLRIVSLFEVQLAAYLQSELSIPISGVY